MKQVWVHVRLAFLFVVLSSIISGASAQDRLAVTLQPDQPLNQWVIQVAAGVDPALAAAQAGLVLVGEVQNMPGYYIVEAPLMMARDAAQARAVTRGINAVNGITFAEQLVLRQHVRRVPTDPAYPNQWHLNNTGQFGGTIGADANVVPAWNAGYNGTGVRIAVVDDGVEHTHPDISPNYDTLNDYDINDNDDDPNDGWNSWHGTSASGVAAAADDGSVCGVGAAYNATLMGIRVLGAATTDAQDAAAMAHGIYNDIVHISTNSWGPSDDGQQWGGAGTLALNAIRDGAAYGRAGKGVIYTWAGGNGLLSKDHTGADAWVNSPFTIGVAASTNSGVQSYYSENGSALLVNAPSNGGTAGITTTDVTDSFDGNCTSSFGGTSSAAPLVAGVVALILDANPNLTWRDVQAILILSAEKNDPTGSGWAVNGAGHDVNHRYGFGRVDAGAAVVLAQTWTPLAPAQHYATRTLAVNKAIPDGGAVIGTVNVPVDVSIEHVEVVLNVTHARRGDLRVVLTSPDGTSSVMLEPRPNDTGANINNYRFLSMRHWGEMSAGTWTLRVIDKSINGIGGTFRSWTLHINNPYRTSVKNNHMGVDKDKNGLPDQWTASGRKASTDFILMTIPFDQNVYQIKGNGGNKNGAISQTVSQIIPSDAAIEYGAYVAAAGGYAGGGTIQLTLNYSDSTSETRTLTLPSSTFAWQYFREVYVVPKEVSSYTIRLGYEANPSPTNAVVRFDQAFVRPIAYIAGGGGGPMSQPVPLPLPAPMD